MSYLQGRGIHVDKHLTNVALNYSMQNMFIAPAIFPVVNVPKQSDMIKTYNQGDLWRQERTLRAPGTEANRISFQVSSDSYIAQNYALRADVTVEDRANADAAFVRDLEEGRARFLVDQLMLDWEVRVAALVTNTSNVGTSTAVASAWTDNTNSDPLSDVLTQIDNVQDTTGYRPNRIIFGNDSWRHFSRNDAIIDKVNKTGVTGGGDYASIDQAARLLQVEQVMVGKNYYNTAAEGIAATLTPIWDDDVLVYYAPSSPSIEQPSYGYTFRWTQPGLQNMNVRRLPFDANKQTEGMEIGFYQDEKILSTAFAALVTATNSST